MEYLIIIALGFLALCGAPIFVILGSTALYLFYAAGIDISAVIIELYRMANAPTLAAIPFFTFAGYLLAESKAPTRLVDLYKACFGWMPGGIAIVAIIVCAFFTAFTGASGVTIIALGGLVLPIMMKEQYSEKFSLGLVTCCGSVGLLFPPSLPIILYGLIASVSIDQMFLAGILPGILLIAVLSIFSILKEGRNASREPFVFSHIISTVKAAGWEIPIPMIILVGIYGGFFTATEAAVVTVVYVLFVEVVIKKDVSVTKDLPKIIKESMVLVGGILIILGVALGLTNFMVDAQIPMKLFELVREYITSKYVFLIVLNIFLLIVGCLMDIFSAIIVVVPLIAPVAKEFGVNPLHLGIIFLMNLEIGYMTPPVGLNLFISSFRFKKPIATLYRASLPFLFVMLIVLMIITYWPDLSLWLVNMFVS